MTVSIYQFCRKFDNVRYSDVYKCYVSGGYAFEKITQGNQAIPQVIRQAVINGYFKLNDNYPPEENDFALIAREIDNKYSVLAVANRQLDDGGRPTIGYKYFWLEKSSSDVDGIGTLILWWSDNQSQFKMAELLETSPPEILYSREEYSQLTFPFQSPWLEEISDTIIKLDIIPHTFPVKKQEYKGLSAYIELHYLALGLSQRANCVNAWAWNVKKIEYPETFSAIFYASLEDIPRDINKRNLPPLPQPNHALNPANASHQNPVGSKSPSTEINNPNEEPQEPTPSPVKILNQIPPATEKKIRTCLSSLANTFNQHGLDIKKSEQLFTYLRDYADADWSGCIDPMILKNEPIHEIYPQLAYLVAPSHRSSENWLLKMVQSLELPTKKTSQSNSWITTTRNWANQSNTSNQTTNFLEFQRVFLEASYQCEDHQVIYKLEDSIYYGISYLLIYLITHEQNSMIENQIDYLLTQSDTIWSGYFQKYANTVAKVILSEDNEEARRSPSIIDFCNTIIEIIEKIKKTHEEHKQVSYGNYINYQKLAKIFSEIGHKKFAELLYRISGSKGDQIPRDCRDKLDPDMRKIFGQPIEASPWRSSMINSRGNDDRGDGGAKAIFGFLFFLAGSIIFFYRLKDWTGTLIFIPITFLILCSIVAIAFTGNPFKITNIRINQVGSWFYMFLAVAFLVGGISPKIDKIINIPHLNRCESHKSNLLENYQIYTECYSTASEQDKKQQLQEFIPDPNSVNKDAQLTKAINFLSNIQDDKDFNTKIKKLGECKQGESNDFCNCLVGSTTASKSTPNTTNKKTPQQCSIDTLNKFKGCEDDTSKITAFREVGININSTNEMQSINKYLSSSHNENEYKKKKQIIQLHKCNQNHPQQNDYEQCVNNIP